MPVLFDAVSSNYRTAYAQSDSNSTASLIKFNHSPAGSNVLFMDGHVEFMRYGKATESRYPVDDETAYGLRLVGMTI